MERFSLLPLPCNPRIRKRETRVGRLGEVQGSGKVSVDHIELFMPDRYEASAWYEKVLGLGIVRGLEEWALPEGGPLMVSGDGGATKLALFEGEARGSRETAGHHRVAFRVDGASFLRFLEGLEQAPVYDDEGRETTALRVIDFDRAYSVYFCDPWGNRFEVTTYEHAEVASLPKPACWTAGRYW